VKNKAVKDTRCAPYAEYIFNSSVPPPNIYRRPLDKLPLAMIAEDFTARFPRPPRVDVDWTMGFFEQVPSMRRPVDVKAHFFFLLSFRLFPFS